MTDRKDMIEKLARDLWETCFRASSKQMGTYSEGWVFDDISDQGKESWIVVAEEIAERWIDPVVRLRPVIKIRKAVDDE